MDPEQCPQAIGRRVVPRQRPLSIVDHFLDAVVHDRHQDLFLAAEMMEQATRLQADGARQFAHRRALVAVLAEEPACRQHQLPRHLHLHAGRFVARAAVQRRFQRNIQIAARSACAAGPRDERAVQEQAVVGTERDAAAVASNRTRPAPRPAG
ncbi:hypothetical protein G6F59_016176 [Rhizopus arrhizus]|nr:hypothetical protein G6F59_016176 [Rhizopus arrhizus]